MRRAAWGRSGLLRQVSRAGMRMGDGVEGEGPAGSQRSRGPSPGASTRAEQSEAALARAVHRAPAPDSLAPSRSKACQHSTRQLPPSHSQAWRHSSTDEHPAAYDRSKITGRDRALGEEGGAGAAKPLSQRHLSLQPEWRSRPPPASVPFHPALRPIVRAGSPFPGLATSSTPCSHPGPTARPRQPSPNRNLPALPLPTAGLASKAGTSPHGPWRP